MEILQRNGLKNLRLDKSTNSSKLAWEFEGLKSHRQLVALAKITINSDIGTAPPD